MSIDLATLGRHQLCEMLVKNLSDFCSRGAVHYSQALEAGGVERLGGGPSGRVDEFWLYCVQCRLGGRFAWVLLDGRALRGLA